MSAPAFTPGPWEEWHDGKFVEVWAKEGSRRPVVKWTGFDGCDRPLAEQVANARLIAAAPALYEALENILDWAFDGPVYDAAVAALKQARGEL